MYLVDAQNNLLTALGDYARARGLEPEYVKKYVEDSMSRLDDYCSDDLDEQNDPSHLAFDTPPDTPSLDTSFHDNEMAVD